MNEQTRGARPTRILITNVHSIRNSGDRVLLQVALDFLHQRYPHAEITLAMNDPAGYPPDRPEQVVGSFTRWLTPHQPGSRGWRWAGLLRAPFWLLQIWWAARTYRTRGRASWLPRSAEHRALVEAYCRADVVVSCAGNFLYSSGRVSLSLLLHLLALVYGAWAGKPVYMLPQTLGPFRAAWETWLLGKSLAWVRVVMVRDRLSKQLLDRAGIRHAQVVVVPDIAFLYAGHDQSFVQELLSSRGVAGNEHTPLLGVSLIDWQAQHGLFDGQEGYEAAVAAAVRGFVAQTGGIAVLFAQVYGPTPADDDRNPARRVAAQLEDLGDRVIRVEKELPPEQLKAAYGAMDVFLGSRLHANIFALCEGRPVLAVAYQYKTHGVMQMLGLGQWVIDMEEAVGERLHTRLTQLWAEREQVSAQVRQAVGSVQSDAARALNLIRTDTPANKPGAQS